MPRLASLQPGFPRGARGKEPTCQCKRRKRRRFSLWVGKIPFRRKWEPAPVSFPGKSHGLKNLVGYSPWSHKESERTDEHTDTHTHKRARTHTHTHSECHRKPKTRQDQHAVLKSRDAHPQQTLGSAPCRTPLSLLPYPGTRARTARGNPGPRQPSGARCPPCPLSARPGTGSRTCRHCRRRGA